MATGFPQFALPRNPQVPIPSTSPKKDTWVKCEMTALDSNLGSMLLFLLYIIDIKAGVKCKFLLCADYAALIVSGKHAQTWLFGNKLSLHLGKTESVLFVSKIKPSKNLNLHIQCSNTNINAKSHVKYLGTISDSTGPRESAVLDVVKKRVSSWTKFCPENQNTFEIQWNCANTRLQSHLIIHVLCGILV